MYQNKLINKHAILPKNSNSSALINKTSKRNALINKTSKRNALINKTSKRKYNILAAIIFGILPPQSNPINFSGLIPCLKCQVSKSKGRKKYFKNCKKYYFHLLENHNNSDSTFPSLSLSLCVELLQVTSDLILLEHISDQKYGISTAEFLKLLVQNTTKPLGDFEN